MTCASELYVRLTEIVPDHADTALSKARRHAETTTGTMRDYLQWCVDRAMEGAAMPWVDPEWEVRRAFDVAGVEFVPELLPICKAMVKAGFSAQDFIAGLRGMGHVDAN